MSWLSLAALLLLALKGHPVLGQSEGFLSGSVRPVGAHQLSVRLVHHILFVHRLGSFEEQLS